MMDELTPPKSPDPLVPAVSPRLLLSLLAAALLLQNVVWPMALQYDGDDWPAPAAIGALGIAFAEISLAAALLVWGTRYLLARGLVALLMYGGAGYMAAVAVNSPGLKTWMATMLVVWAIIAIPLAIARLAGVVVLRAGESDAPRGSRQFTILGLLSLTTLVAGALGIAQRLQFPWGELGGIALFTLALGAIAWTLLPLLLSRIPLLGSILAAGVICPLMGVAMAHTGFPPEEPVELTAMCLVMGAVIVAACAAVRVAGYRLAGPWEG
jgi:hypothetical protein